MLVIAWLLCGNGWAAGGTAGVQVGVMAAAGSATSDVDGQLGAWVAYAPRPWGIALDLASWRHVDGAKPYDEGSSLYRMSRVDLRGAVLVELTAGTHATTFHAGLGPALGWSSTRVRFGGRDVTSSGLVPGVAGRVALDGPIVGAVGWQWRVGVTSRAFDRVDYDTALGLGVCF